MSISDCLIREEFIGQTPMLHVVGRENWETCYPTIFILHGFMTAKESNLTLAYLLSQAGFRVILPDMPHHGVRRQGERSRQELEFYFWDMIEQTVEEIDCVRLELERRGQSTANGYGVAGISMGGFAAFRALTNFSWLSTGVSLMGSPDWVGSTKKYIQENGHSLERFAAEMDKIRGKSPLEFADRLKDKALLFWHGQEDKRVLIEGVRKLYQRLKEDYGMGTEKLRLIEVPRHGHYVTEEAHRLTVGWFSENLKVNAMARI